MTVDRGRSKRGGLLHGTAPDRRAHRRDVLLRQLLAEALRLEPGLQPQPLRSAPYRRGASDPRGSRLRAPAAPCARSSRSPRAAASCGASARRPSC